MELYLLLLRVDGGRTERGQTDAERTQCGLCVDYDMTGSGSSRRGFFEPVFFNALPLHFSVFPLVARRRRLMIQKRRTCVGACFMYTYLECGMFDSNR